MKAVGLSITHVPPFRQGSGRQGLAGMEKLNIHNIYDICYTASSAGVKIRLARGPITRMRSLKINTWRARRARRFCGDSNTVMSPTSEKRKSVPSKDCEGPQNITLWAQMTFGNFCLF